MSRTYTLNEAQMVMLEWFLSEIGQEKMRDYVQEQLSYQEQMAEEIEERGEAVFSEQQLLVAIDEMVEAVDTSGLS